MAVVSEEVITVDTVVVLVVAIMEALAAVLGGALVAAVKTLVSYYFILFVLTIGLIKNVRHF
jgi:hypothetical protein